MSAELVALLAMQTDAKQGLDLPDLLARLDLFTSGSPASFTRLVYEQVVITDTHILQVVPVEQYLTNFILQTNPFISKFIEEPIWTDYLKKYDLMTRERITMCLRNSARQRRQNRRFFADLAILTNEANFTDEKLLRSKKINVTQSNTTALSLSIGMTLEMMVRYLDQAF